jgi:Leucine-rich repeat (LRR) protein
LENLEILDLKGNELSGLPDGIERLTRLRVLNIGENAFESLPFGVLAGLPLIELLAHKNKLAGTLVDVDVEILPHLQTLDVSSNRLTLLALGKLSMPSLLQCTVSLNRLQALPDISSWKVLLTLNAGENSIAAIPDGFTSLNKLRHVDFTGNDIRAIPPEIARMDSLSMLRISGNPLRDKKFTSMTTEDLKDSLSARLESLTVSQSEPEQLEGSMCSSGGGDNSGTLNLNTEEVAENTDGDHQSELDDFTTPPTSAQQSPVQRQTPSRTVSSQTWPIKSGGILDRASTQSSSLHPVVCSKIAADQVVRDVRLQHNMFTSMPESLSFFADTLTMLVMSHNQLVGESYLSEQLELLALKELTLSHNHITSLRPLASHLRAPNLHKLDVSFNRVASLPVLRDAFPVLAILLVSNNHLEDLDPDSVSGLRVVAADNNDIAHLNPRLGLLRLGRLEVNGNRFRVPRWNVLERGTEATLRWLRGRVPVAEMTEWKAKYGEDADDNGDVGGFD